MGLVKDAWNDFFKKKSVEESYADKQAKIAKVQSELDFLRKQEEAKYMARKKEETMIPEPSLPEFPEQKEEYKAEFVKPEYSQEKEEREIEEDLTTEQRLAILEQNMMTVINDLHKRLSDVEQFLIRNFR